MITREDIEKLFANQLEQINSHIIRDKVVNTWVKACEYGKWETVEDLKKIPFSLLTDVRGVNLIEHTIAVTEGAIGLARAQVQNYASLPYKIDFDRLVAGGLLHDVGKLLEIERDEAGGYRKSYRGKCLRHPISGAILAAKEGLPEEVQNIIACHAKEGDNRPQTVETVFIHQADFATFNPLVMLKKGDLIQSQ